MYQIILIWFGIKLSKLQYHHTTPNEIYVSSDSLIEFTTNDMVCDMKLMRNAYSKIRIGCYNYLSVTSVASLQYIESNKYKCMVLPKKY